MPDILSFGISRGCERAWISRQMSTMEIVHYFQNGFHRGHLVEKNLDVMDFLCISLGSEKNNHPILLS